MARPRKTGMDYFPHDCNASTDEKLERLELRYPNGVGYAWYFKALERIYRTGGELVSSLETPLILARNLTEKSDEILKDALDIGLFDKKLFEENGVITSDSIKKRVAPILQNRNYSAKYHEKQVSSLETHCETPQSDPQIKIKETKEKEIKEEKIKDKSVVRACFKKPSVDEIKAYCIERKNTIDAQHFFDHYESNGWKVGGKSPMKDWKASIRTWEKNEINRSGSNGKNTGTNSGRFVGEFERGAPDKYKDL